MASVCVCGHKRTEHYAGPYGDLRCVACAACGCLGFEEPPEYELEDRRAPGDYKATFEEVLDAIASERVYQGLLWDDKEHTVTEWLCFIRDYVEEALHTVSRQSEPACDYQALENMRKIAGMTVCCMQQHGAPHREIPEDMAEAFAKHGIIRKKEGE